MNFNIIYNGVYILIRWIIALFFLILIITPINILAAINNSDSIVNCMPAAPDYNDATQWYHIDRKAAADIFYIISTETGDYYTPNGTLCHYADTYNDSLRLPMKGEMKGVDALISGRLNYYSPYYRQCSLQSFVNDTLAKSRLQLPTDDVRRAFNHYIEYENNGRPFIIAGYSKGAMIALSIINEMSDETFRRMVAAYIIGAIVTQQDIDLKKNIRGATAANDLGVTICYNSVKNASSTIFKRSAIAINPVIWTTDTTPATLITVPSPKRKGIKQKKDTLNIHLDKASNLLFVDGYTGTDYILPLIGKEGNYHSKEVWLYREQLRKNIKLRTKTFLKQSKKKKR